MKRISIALAAGLTLAAGASWAHGHEHGHGQAAQVRALSTQVQARHCWVRLMPGRAPAAAYLELENQGEQTVQLTGASSPSYGRAMVHQSSDKDGMSHMSHADAVAVPAGGRLTLQPGAYHVMLEKPAAKLAIGESITLSLHLSDDTQVQTQCELRPPKTQSY